MAPTRQSYLTVVFRCLFPSSEAHFVHEGGEEDVGNSPEHDLNVLCVCGAGEMSVDMPCLLFAVLLQKLLLYVRRSLVEVMSSL
jgi:hypothetical protein